MLNNSVGSSRGLGSNIKRTIRKNLSFLKQRLQEVAYKSLAEIRHLTGGVGSRPHLLNGKLIISLTSYPPRFEKLHLTIKTLLSQKLSADLIILWIYDKDLDELPWSVKRLQGRYFEVRTTSVDIRSFKKLIPTLKHYPDAYIVTADDDFYYPRDWLSQLVENYDPALDEVVGLRAHRILLDEEGRLLPYNAWDWMTKSKLSDERIFLTSGGGVLFSPGCLHKDVLDERVFLQLCPTADDIWLYFMLRRNGYLCRKVGRRFATHTWSGTQEIALGKDNVDRSVNDVSIQKMIDKFGMPF